MTQSGRFWEEVNFVLLPGIESRLLERSSFNPVLGGFLSQSGRFWEEVNFVLLSGIESRLLERSSYNPVTTPTMLSRLYEVSLTS